MKKNLRSLIISLVCLVLGFIIGPLLVRFVEDIPATLFYPNSITEVETGIWKIQTKEGETLYFSATEPTIYDYRKMEKALGEESSEEFSVTFYLDGLNPSVNVLTKIHFRNGITIFRYGPANPNIPENELSNYASMYEIYIEAKTITNTTTANLGSSGIFIIIIFLKQSKKLENSLKIYYYMQDVMTYFTIDLYPEISWM